MCLPACGLQQCTKSPCLHSASTCTRNQATRLDGTRVRFKRPYILFCMTTSGTCAQRALLMPRGSVARNVFVAIRGPTTIRSGGMSGPSADAGKTLCSCAIALRRSQ